MCDYLKKVIVILCSSCGGGGLEPRACPQYFKIGNDTFTSYPINSQA